MTHLCGPQTATIKPIGDTVTKIECLVECLRAMIKATCPDGNQTGEIDELISYLSKTTGFETEEIWANLAYLI